MKKRNCKRIAIALAAASMLQLSVQAAEGTAELIQSDAFSDAADILSNTLAELGDSFTLETEEDFTLSEEKSLKKAWHAQKPEQNGTRRTSSRCTDRGIP